MMSSAIFTFSDGLHEFLPAKRRGLSFAHVFDKTSTIKDMIEALGVPHTEIDAITVNDAGVDFGYMLTDGDVVAVYDREKLPPQVVAPPLRPPTPPDARFVLDVHLGQLAAYLRMLGFDTLYRNDYADDELARISNFEERILLTRDVGLLKRMLVVYGYFVRQTNPQQQVVEIVKRYDLVGRFTPLLRCIKCNHELRRVDKAEVADRLEAHTAVAYDEFSLCPNCGQIYWKGSHYDNMRQFIAGVLGQA